MKENLDFSSHFKNVTQNIMMPFSSSFVPRTPVDVLKSSSMKDKNKDFSSKVASYNIEAKVIKQKETSENAQICPC